MRTIDYVIMDPTGNITILVESAVDVSLQPYVAAQIMKREPSAEQAGFLSPRGGGIALRMAGGEFCGNAAMSTAAYHALRNGIARGFVDVDFCGTPDPVRVSVSALDDGSMRATVRMPGALSVEEKALPGGYSFPVVSFDGILHVIAGAFLERDEAEKHIREWCEYLGADALGIMILDEAAGRLSPLVYVPSAGTMFWENSCASGTSAVGAYLRERQGEVRVSLAQPGGTLTIEARKDGELLLTGTVRELSRGSIEADI